MRLPRLVLLLAVPLGIGSLVPLAGYAAHATTQRQARARQYQVAYKVILRKFEAKMTAADLPAPAKATRAEKKAFETRQSKKLAVAMAILMDRMDHLKPPASLQEEHDDTRARMQLVAELCRP